MPVTPFHFGLGAALHSAAPKRVSFLSFCAANVLIDVESLYNLVLGQHPVHAFMHTFVGATLMVVATVALFLVLRSFASKFWLPNPFGWQSLLVPPVALGAALGAYSHVVLDSVMHADIQPFSPFSSANPLLGVIPLGTLHLALLVLAALGVAVVGLRSLHSGGGNAS
ncbi:hypothetical protein [Paucibacter sp. DJ2R-2]|uniref:hypothetical protein n=1 Tax=Paucibacter sp. DJ2R-2 TaxID=2893558 RepID=UPI0021E394B1|nr:hypothetical protein [Paucibacter sp. DJ2R-2]MCV2419112.1 hypothetical protein [Paucibacter sp. DJ4R-1]MCV2437933.1 hypothetical protein [Paucibacter sp. DJ2R-2]